MFIGERQNSSSWPEAGERLDGSIRLCAYQTNQQQKYWKIK